VGSTSRFELDYPALTDAPNGPQQLQALAEGVEGWLGRAFPCTSTTRPTGIGTGFFIYETDTAKVLIWDGNSWEPPVTVTTTPGGGGGGTTPDPATVSTVSATYAATAAQPISSNSDVVVAFGVAQTTETAVTRNASGAGHSFTLNQTRLWTVSTTLQIDGPSGITGRRTFELRAGSNVLARATAGPYAQPFAVNLSVTRRLPAGTVITAIARHTHSSGLPLEPNSGQYVHIDLAGI
jgi:hypothetical protein